ncbi:cilia- and flagella-associated protein 221 isoform X2 [Siniperca chuatsi]|uniref:cilia- and flagella-associated protein 221 isoform X2 n=1 Tax=Siniperca chuatsi TaxID=119488 RepID=UPI001CE02C58|nr:cilia- and flagella-associated protein 221 isoform X2 [Siniperca chuatsi]
MEVALSAPQILSEPPKRRTPLPLSQLVEESRSIANIPNHLLESKIYAKLKSNSLIQAEPPVLHFSGFELGKDYIKILKLINISSEVMNIHIIPTQTKHFQTTYTKKYRLIPGLAYTLRVRFCPDEWRYFYDCVRVHCKGEENLLIPVHAYPVIDDLHIPPHIDLSSVPLGQSVCHAIPLRCSCPIDFEFQVCVIQPHEAFSIHPLTGVIPANGEVKIIVTFRPFQYETSQVTIQLIISQFNTKPYLCTITGSSAPHLALGELGRKSGHGDVVPAEYKGPSPATQVPPRRKNKYRSTKEADKLRTLRDQASDKPGLKPLADVCTPAGVVKMLIKDTNKLCSKDLREAISCGSMLGLQNRQMKEALFMRKVQQNVKEEQANHLRWHAHLGKDPVSEHTRRQIAEEREIALHEYMVKRGDVRHEEDFAAGQPKLSSRRVLCEAGQACKGAPSFQFYSSFQWELRQRALRLFQQAARKVVIRCRMNQRLTCLKKLSDSMKNLPLAKKEEMTCDLKISPDRVFPFAFPIFSDEDDPLAHSNLVPVPVDPIDVTVTTHIPFFKLQVPQHYKLMGYRPVSAWEAFNSYIPTTLARPLRSGAPDELVPNEVGAQHPTTMEPKAWEGQQHEHEEEDVGAKEAASLTFIAPEALLRPFPANPLRIFNPAPGLQTYKPTPKYLESDLEFHLCPLPRYTVPESNMRGIRTQTPHTQRKFLDRKEVITGLMTWKNFDSITSRCLSNQPALTSDCALRRSVDYSTDILPLTAPPPLLTGPPDDLAPLMDKPCEGSGVQLTPEMIRAEFLSGEALVSNSNLTRGTAARHQRELQMEATYRSEFNQMGKRVMTRLKQLGVTDRTSHSPDDCEKANTPPPTYTHTHKTSKISSVHTNIHTLTLE